MYFNRFDICLAYYHFLSQHYDGQWDPRYARSCRLDKYFKPGMREEYLECLDDDGNENAKEIYEALVAKDERANV